MGVPSHPLAHPHSAALLLTRLSAANPAKPAPAVEEAEEEEEREGQEHDTAGVCPLHEGACREG